MKKALVMIYPQFSMQEISCLTEIISYNQKEMVVCAKDKLPVMTEDGFLVLATCSYQEVNLQDYDCLILPGICAFTHVLKDDVHIEFLRQFQNHSEILIGSISSSVALLAKAGLLQDKKFTGGLYPESLRDLPFIQEENFVKQAICLDHNIITAYGPAYRQFAFAMAQQLHLTYDVNCFGKIADEYPPETFDMKMDEANLQFWQQALHDLNYK